MTHSNPFSVQRFQGEWAVVGNTMVVAEERGPMLYGTDKATAVRECTALNEEFAISRDLDDGLGDLYAVG